MGKYIQINRKNDKFRLHHILPPNQKYFLYIRKNLDQYKDKNKLISFFLDDRFRSQAENVHLKFFHSLDKKRKEMLNNSAVPTVELEQPLFQLRTNHIFLENEENVLRESGVSIGIDLLQNNSEALEVAQEALFVFYVNAIQHY